MFDYKIPSYPGAKVALRKLFKENFDLNIYNIFSKTTTLLLHMVNAIYKYERPKLIITIMIIQKLFGVRIVQLSFTTASMVTTTM